MSKACFLFGHRDTPQDVLPEIIAAVEQHYQNLGIRIFYSGCYGTFDALAATALKEIKKKYSDISLYLLIPFHPAERPVPVPDGYDGTFYPPLEHTPRRFAIIQANRYMVKSCDSIICYVSHPGNTRDLYQIACKQGCMITNLASN